MEAPRAERAICFDPILENSTDHSLECSLQLRKAVSQQKTQIDRLGTIIKLTFVNGESRRLGERARKTVPIKEVLQIILYPLRKRVATCRMPGQRMNLGEGLHDKTGVEMIDKVTHSVRSIVPGTIAIL